MPTVLLVRHGRTTANSAGTLAGWTPGIGLDEHGEQQARALGQRISAAQLTVCRVVTSPLERCVQTAQGLLGGLEGPAVPVAVDERLGECRYGAWTGRAIKELVEEPLWRTVQDHPSAAVFPDGSEWPGESLAAMQARAVQAVRGVDASVRAEHGEAATWVVVSHGDVLKAVLADALGMHLDAFQRIVVDPGSVSVVRYTDRRPFVLRTNDVGGDLAGLRPPPQPTGDAVVGGGAGGDPDASAATPAADQGAPSRVG